MSRMPSSGMIPLQIETAPVPPPVRVSSISASAPGRSVLARKRIERRDDHFFDAHLVDFLQLVADRLEDLRVDGLGAIGFFQRFTAEFQDDALEARLIAG